MGLRARASGKKHASKRRPQSILSHAKSLNMTTMKARRRFFGALGGAALVGTVVSFAWVDKHRAQLELGVGYAARVGCGCYYIGGRPLGDCHKDFEPGMEPIQLSENQKTKTITASVPLIASRSVRYDAVLGCQPEQFQGAALIVH